MRTRLAVAALAVAVALAAWPGSPAASTEGAIVPKLGVDPTTVHAPSVKGAQRLADGSWAVPLRAQKPDWLTPELEAAARREPQSAPEQAIPDVPASGFVGIRPGSWMVSPAGCTMNFVFGTPGKYSIGTAGHCVEKVGEPVILLTVAPGGDNPARWVLVEVGTVQKRVDGGVGNDFALVSIKPEYQPWVFTTQAQVGGPCGMFTGDGLASVEGWNALVKGEEPIEPGHEVFHYGHGLVIGTGGTPRAGAATSWGSDAFYWAGAVLFGDSGSAARIETLQAAGDVTHLVVDLRVPAYNAGTRIAKMVKIAGKPLANSPYC